MKIEAKRNQWVVVAFFLVVVLAGLARSCHAGSHCCHSEPDSRTDLVAGLQILTELQKPTTQEESVQLVGVLRRKCQSVLREALYIPPRVANTLLEELDRVAFILAGHDGTPNDDVVRLRLANVGTILTAMDRKANHTAGGVEESTSTAPVPIGARNGSRASVPSLATSRAWVSNVHPNQSYFVDKPCGFCGGTGRMYSGSCGICNGRGVIRTDPGSERCGFCGGKGYHQGPCHGCGGTGWAKVDLPDPYRLYEFRKCAYCGGDGWTPSGSGCSICGVDGWNQIPRHAPVCPNCQGSGRGSSGPCSRCYGTGYARVPVSQPGGAGTWYPLYPPASNVADLVSLQLCGLCGGTGYYGGNFCPACTADGYVSVPNPPVRCKTCKGKGQVNNQLCSLCGATGWQDGALYTLPPGRAICRTCNGQGAISNGVFCSVCNGHGWVIAGQGSNQKTCGMCKGQGFVNGAFCPACNGGGWARMMLPGPERP